MSSASAPNSHTATRQGRGPTWKATKKDGRSAVSGVDQSSPTAPGPRHTPRTRGVCRDDRATTTPGHRHSCLAPVRLDVAIQEELLAAVNGQRGVDAADRLCEACVMLFGVDAAAISLVFDGTNNGTLGSSGAPARMYDELQLILGEGPCLDSVTRRAPVLVVDLADPKEVRWPVYGPAMLDLQVRGVYAMPVVVAGEYIGALDLFRIQPGQLAGEQVSGASVAAELAG